MLSRSLLAITAAALAAVAGFVSQADGDTSLVPFFVGLTGLGATGAFVFREPSTERRRILGAMVATVPVALAARLTITLGSRFPVGASRLVPSRTSGAGCESRRDRPGSLYSPT